MNQILITEGTNTQLKPASVESVDIHLPEGKSCNIILPNESVIVVSSTEVNFFDSTDTLMKVVSPC